MHKKWHILKTWVNIRKIDRYLMSMFFLNQRRLWVQCSLPDTNPNLISFWLNLIIYPAVTDLQSKILDTFPSHSPIFFISMQFLVNLCPLSGKFWIRRLSVFLGFSLKYYFVGKNSVPFKTKTSVLLFASESNLLFINLSISILGHPWLSLYISC